MGAHPDAAAGHAQLGLRLNEDIVPEARLQVALHLGQVEVGPWTNTRLRIMARLFSGRPGKRHSTLRNQIPCGHGKGPMILHIYSLTWSTCWSPGCRGLYVNKEKPLVSERHS